MNNKALSGRKLISSTPAFLCLLLFLLLGGIGDNSVAQTLTTVYSFTGGNDGQFPLQLNQGADGNFYGMAYEGGTDGAGTVFRLSASTPYVLTTLRAQISF